MEKDMLMQILATLTRVWVIFNEPLNTTTSILALPKNWGREMKKEVHVIP